MSTNKKRIIAQTFTYSHRQLPVHTNVWSSRNYWRSLFGRV